MSTKIKGTIISSLLLFATFFAVRRQIRINSSTTRLTLLTYDTLTAGRTVVILFHVDWCHHCAAFRPIWRSLALEYRNHAFVRMAEVDCSSDAQGGLCERHGVPETGFPSILYGDPAEDGVRLRRFRGSRQSSDALRSHLERLRPVCSPEHLVECDPVRRAVLERFLSRSDRELSEAAGSLRAEVDAARAAAEAALEEAERAQEGLNEAIEAARPAIQMGKPRPDALGAAERGFREKRGVYVDKQNELEAIVLKARKGGMGDMQAVMRFRLKSGHKRQVGESARDAKEISNEL